MSQSFTIGIQTKSREDNLKDIAHEMRVIFEQFYGSAEKNPTKWEEGAYNLLDRHLSQPGNENLSNLELKQAFAKAQGEMYSKKLKQKVREGNL